MRKVYALVLMLLTAIGVKAATVGAAVAARGCPPCPFCK